MEVARQLPWRFHHFLWSQVGSQVYQLNFTKNKIFFDMLRFNYFVTSEAVAKGVAIITIGIAVIAIGVAVIAIFFKFIHHLMAVARKSQALWETTFKRMNCKIFNART